MKSALETDDANFLFPANLDSMRTRQLDRAFRRFRTCRKQENFLQRFRRKLCKKLDEFCALFARENIIVQQAAVDLLDDGIANFFWAVPRVSHQHSARPIQP